MSQLLYEGVTVAPELSDLRAVAQHMYALMVRNLASDGFVFVDPLDAGHFSSPGCIIAAPSYPGELSTVDQDYVFNWTRDAAIAAFELAVAAMPVRPGSAAQPLVDYATFARSCQTSNPPTIGHACYTIEGQPRPWTVQSDGPALQTLALLKAYSQLDAPGQGTAATVIAANLDYLLSVYESTTTNLWEERQGYSFFARAVQLRCLRQVESNTFGIAVPAGVTPAIAWLEDALGAHWNGRYYVTLLAPPLPGSPPPSLPPTEAYDPNIDVVMASVYGAVPCTDTRLLATAGLLRRQWADSASPSFYPVNAADKSRGYGPLLGRYPGDSYDGDVAEPVAGGHPWALCSCNFAELYFRLASSIARTKRLPLDDLSADFFAQVAVDSTTPPEQAVASLQGAGDAILDAVVFHSDHLELSEQFDGTTGYEKSVRDLTWSYAAFLSAVRARTGTHVAG
jgi:glucoamylase